MSAIYRGEKVRVLYVRGTKAKIATARGLCWAQLRELEVLK